MTLKFEPPKLTLVQDNMLSNEQFKFITSLIFEKAGILLDDNKTTMVQSRILRRLKRLDLPTVDEYIKYLKSHPQEAC